MTRVTGSTVGGTARGAQVSILDHDNCASSDLLAVSRFNVVEEDHA